MSSMNSLDFWRRSFSCVIAKESVLPVAPALSCVSVALRLDEEGRLRRLPLCSRVRGWFWLFDCREGGLSESITIREPFGRPISLISQKALKLCRLKQDAWAAATRPNAYAGANALPSAAQPAPELAVDRLAVARRCGTQFSEVSRAA